MSPKCLTALILSVIAGFAAGCRTPHAPSQDAPMTAAPTTPHPPQADEYSFANPHVVSVQHLDLDLELNFTARTLAGTATLDLIWNQSSGTELILDTRELSVHKVEAAQGTGWAEVPFQFATPDLILGSKLTIPLAARPTKVRITYATSPMASGLQWLTPAMTLGKKSPFLFSQSQPIHARSWVPLQDTPGVRFTYTAHVKAPADIMVLMSADNDPKAPRDGDYRFRMPQRIPSYLLAIAAGDLVFQPITHRCGIWAEPDMVAKTAYEFADTGRMMEVAERLYGRYRWDRYDILMLPPSFPYGGMENPRLTFASPTVVTGDRSLVSLVAHELAHSWSGNLVTFSSNRDMWLNEGFTTYVEARIIEALYGRERADMENVTGRNELKAEFTPSNQALQVLAIPPGALKDPDGHLTATVYTKGAWFLEFLEQRFGRAAFDRFLRGYFDHFAFQSISTPQFVAYATTHLFDRYPGKLQPGELEAWLHQPGIPPSAPQSRSPRLEAVDAARATWIAQGTLPPAKHTDSWTTLEWVHFLAEMPSTLSTPQLEALDKAFRFSGTPNAEIAKVWYPLTIRSGYTAARPAIADYLSRVGRRRMILSTYQALAKAPGGLEFAREIFNKARESMHPITARAVENVLAGTR